MEHRVYAALLSKGSWRRRVVKLDASRLVLERPDGSPDVVVASPQGVAAASTAVEAAETAAFAEKDALAAKLQDKIGAAGSLSDVLCCMLCVSFDGEGGHRDTAFVCYEDPMLRDVWLRRAQDVLAPAAALEGEVGLLCDDLRSARDDLQATTEAAYASPRLLLRSSCGGDDGDDVFEPAYAQHPSSLHHTARSGATATPPQRSLPLATAPASPPLPLPRLPGGGGTTTTTTTTTTTYHDGGVSSSAVVFAPAAPPVAVAEGRRAHAVRTPASQPDTLSFAPPPQQRLTPTAPDVVSGGVSGGAGGDERAHESERHLRSLIAEVEEAEATAHANISRLQQLHARFDDVTADAASWRLEARLASEEACAAALRDVPVLSAAGGRF